MKHFIKNLMNFIKLNTNNYIDCSIINFLNTDTRQ